MKHKTAAFFLVATLGIASLSAQNTKESDARQLYRASLIQVIANPKEFDGQRVRLVGYLDYNGVDRAIGLYVSEVDGRNFILSNSVDVLEGSVNYKSFVGKYVAFSGTYHAPTPHSGSNGYIDKIVDFEQWTPTNRSR